MCTAQRGVQVPGYGTLSCCTRGVLAVPPTVLEAIRVLSEVHLALGSQMTSSEY